MGLGFCFSAWVWGPASVHAFGLQCMGLVLSACVWSSVHGSEVLLQWMGLGFCFSEWVWGSASVHGSGLLQCSHRIKVFIALIIPWIFLGVLSSKTVPIEKKSSNGKHNGRRHDESYEAEFLQHQPQMKPRRSPPQEVPTKSNLKHQRVPSGKIRYVTATFWSLKKRLCYGFNVVEVDSD